jgi:hypothetical protein
MTMMDDTAAVATIAAVGTPRDDALGAGGPAVCEELLLVVVEDLTTLLLVVEV